VKREVVMIGLLRGEGVASENHDDQVLGGQLKEAEVV